MDYQAKYEEETTNIRNDGFKEIASLWQHEDDPDKFAFSTRPTDKGLPDSGVIVQALETILDAIEKQFNSTSIDLGSQTFTYPVTQKPN